MKLLFASLLVGIMTLQAPALSAERAGALETYLAMPEPQWKDQECFGPYQAAIPKYQQAFRTAAREYDKGVAIANLAIIALEMARDPNTRAAARELCMNWVAPNLSTTLPIEQTSTCCWRRTVMRCANLYRLTEDADAEKECLALLYRGNRRDGDQDLAIYLLAYQQASLGQHEQAIKTINHLNQESKWAANRDKLIRDWTKEMSRKRKTTK